MYELESIAYHEAGHTVMAYLINIPVNEVTIIPAEEYAGNANLDWTHILDKKLLELYFNYECPDNMTFEELEEYVAKVVYQFLKTILAGYVTEKIIGFDNREQASDDFERAAGIALRYFQSGEDASKHIDKVLLDVELQLKENWILVEKIANSLLSKKVLKQKDLQLIFGQ